MICDDLDDILVSIDYMKFKNLAYFDNIYKNQK